MKNSIIVFLLAISTSLVAQESVVKLEFSGLKKNKESFIRRLVKVKQGATYDTIKAAEDIERLKRLPGIASASYSANRIPEGVNLEYSIVENFTIIPGVRIATANNGDFSYRLSAFEFNLFGNNQLLGGFYEKNIFNSYGVFWEHPFLFSDKLGIGFNYQDRTTQEPIFFDAGEINYRFNSAKAEGALLFSFDFNNEAEIGASFVSESYDFIEDEDIVTPTPVSLEADKIEYKGVYRYVDLDIDYQYFDGISSEFTGQYFQFLNGSDGADAFLGDFLSLRNDVIYYKKIKQNGNWASRLRLAATIGNDDSPFAPFTLDNQLNIRGVGNTVDRGTAAIVLNTEYRHTFYEKGWFVVQGNAFVDAGSWRNPGEELSQLFDGSTVRFFPGVGLRFIHKKIFNAVFRLDYGFGVGDDNSRGLVFGIGQYF